MTEIIPKLEYVTIKRSEYDYLRAVVEGEKPSDETVERVARALFVYNEGKRISEETINYWFSSSDPECQEVVDDLRAMAKAALAAIAGWRHIVTAPKNGARILAWAREWDAPCTAEFNGYKEWCVHGSPFKYQPTHWMPLPRPPRGDNG